MTEHEKLLQEIRETRKDIDDGFKKINKVIDEVDTNLKILNENVVYVGLGIVLAVILFSLFIIY